MHVENLYRYPVKGLSAEALEGSTSSPDRRCRGTARSPWRKAMPAFDPAHPVFLHKSNFMCLLKNARIAGLRAALRPARPAC